MVSLEGLTPLTESILMFGFAIIFFNFSDQTVKTAKIKAPAIR